MKCDRCGKEIATKASKNGDRLPSGWKRWTDPASAPRVEQVWCNACWRSAFVLRAVTMPVVSVLPGEDGWSWERLRAGLKDAWAATTRLANWAMTRLRCADVTRSPEAAKCPPAPKVYLYPEARKLVPELSSQSTIAVLHAVEGKYRQARYEIVWTGGMSLPTFRYPTPYPVHNRGWHARLGALNGAPDEPQCPIVSLPLDSGRVDLRLAGGREWRRQRVMFDAIARGEAVQGELVVLRQRASGNRRKTLGETQAGGGKRVFWQIAVKMVAWFPRQAQRQREGALVVKCAPDCLLYAVGPNDDRLWTLNADLMARWIAERDGRNHRLAEDRKLETRMPRRRRRRYQHQQDRQNDVHHRREETGLHELAARVAGYAHRRGYAAVEIDVSQPSPKFSRFPWHRFVAMLKEKLNAFGIGCRASGDVVPDLQESLEGSV